MLFLFYNAIIKIVIREYLTPSITYIITTMKNLKANRSDFRRDLKAQKKHNFIYNVLNYTIFSIIIITAFNLLII